MSAVKKELKIMKNAEKEFLGEFFHSKKLLKKDEQLDDLERDGLMLIQNKNGYRFTSDSVLLSDFAKAKTNDVLIDLCSGSGIVAILMQSKNKTKKIFMVEIQKELSDMANRSVLYNGLEGISAICCDLSQTHKILGSEIADVVTVNPPYYENGLTATSDEIAVATHEIKTSLDEICKSAFRLLKFGGKIFMVHLAERLTDIICSLRANHLEPKRLRVVYPKASKEPNLILIEAKKGAKSGLKILPPLVLMNEDGTETDELKFIYNRKK